MKVKRIEIIRPEVDIEFVKPILGRLYFLAVLPKMFIVKKAKINIYINSSLLPGRAGHVKAQNIWIVGIPKFTSRKA